MEVPIQSRARVLGDVNARARQIAAWLIDMDGLLVGGGRPIPGAGQFVEALRAADTPFLVLTNRSALTPRDVAGTLSLHGIEAGEDAIWTGALAMAAFLHRQRPGGSAFLIGGAGLGSALEQVGYALTDQDPDYVVLGESETYNFGQVTHAVRLIAKGARFVATNADASRTSSAGLLPGTGAVAALIAHATGAEPYFVGKPNPLMLRLALNALGAHAETTAIVGDRLDSCVAAGVHAGLETVLVPSGRTSSSDLAEEFPYRPSRFIESLADLLPT